PTPPTLARSSGNTPTPLVAYVLTNSLRQATRVALPGPSALAQASGRESFHRFAWPGIEHRGWHCLGWKVERQKRQDLLHHGRWRTVGRPDLGSGHGSRSSQARQPGWDRGLQAAADRWSNLWKMNIGASVGRSGASDGHNMEQVVEALESAKHN